MQRAPAAAASLVPVALAGGFFRRIAELFAGEPERIAAPVMKAQASIEAASAGKLAAVAASAAAIAGGGVAVKAHDAPAARTPATAKTQSQPPSAPARTSLSHRPGVAAPTFAAAAAREARPWPAPA